MRRRGKYRGGDGGSLWISFSDLMSALMLIFVLVLFYAVYQYYDMLEVKTAELLRQSGLLDEKSSQLTLSQQELEEKENALALAQQTLDDKEAQLNSQSLKLTETEQELLNPIGVNAIRSFPKRPSCCSRRTRLTPFRKSSPRRKTS